MGGKGMRPIMRRVLGIYENVSIDSWRKMHVAGNGRNICVRVKSLIELLETRV